MVGVVVSDERNRLTGHFPVSFHLEKIYYRWDEVGLSCLFVTRLKVRTFFSVSSLGSESG